MGDTGDLYSYTTITHRHKAGSTLGFKTGSFTPDVIKKNWRAFKGKFQCRDFIFRNGKKGKTKS